MDTVLINPPSSQLVGTFGVVPGAVLVLNEGEEYRVDVDALHPVETERA